MSNLGAAIRVFQKTQKFLDFILKLINCAPMTKWHCGDLGPFSCDLSQIGHWSVTVKDTFDLIQIS